MPKASDAVPTAVPLTSLLPGQTGQVVAIEAGPSFGRRLADLGFVPGTLVRVRRSAPLRDPIEYEIRNSRVCLRRSEAGAIGVLPTA